MGNQIEGDLPKGKKVVVVEDLISTGGSSLKAVEALRNEAEANVLGMTAIFTYDFQIARDNFEKANCPLIVLSDYHALLDFALSVDYIKEQQVNTLKQWRENPSEWDAQ